MPSSITSVLSTPYTTYWIVLSPSVSSDTVTVASHPFSTGDKIYASISSTVLDGTGRGWTSLFVIVLSATQFKVATSYANAIASISTAFTTVSGLSNTPVNHLSNATIGITFLTQPWLSNSKSTQSFAVTDNVAIDFTVSEWGHNSGILPVGYKWAAALVSDVGNYLVGISDANYFNYGDSITGMAVHQPTRRDVGESRLALTFNCRFLLQNRTVSIQIRKTDETYQTFFTSSTLSPNIQGLRFFSNFALNGINFTNCTITYL
jgi:hypothetical protein